MSGKETQQPFSNKAEAFEVYDDTPTHAEPEARIDVNYLVADECEPQVVPRWGDPLFDE